MRPTCSDAAWPAFGISARDDNLIGSSSSRDPLGVLPIWSARGRDLVPHLTEQTTSAEGFELLMAIYWLWNRFVSEKPEHSAEQRAFYLIVEQAVAHAAARVNDGVWPLPGKRRVKAQGGASEVSLSIRVSQCHLIQNQLGNGTWGLYRGAAGRAGLLSKGLHALSAPALGLLDARPPFPGRVPGKVMALVEEAFDDPDAEVPFSLHRSNKTVQSMAALIADLPHGAFLWERIVEARPLTENLTGQVLQLGGGLLKLGIRPFLLRAARDLPGHREVIEDVIRCESLLAPLEGIFRWMCRQQGESLASAAGALPVSLSSLQNAQSDFSSSGVYPAGGARGRWRLYADELDTSSRTALLGSLLKLHEQISAERGRAPWVEVDENGRLVTNVEVQPVDAAQLDPARAWRNSYYLGSLESVAGQLQGRQTS